MSVIQHDRLELRLLNTWEVTVPAAAASLEAILLLPPLTIPCRMVSVKPNPANAANFVVVGGPNLSVFATFGFSLQGTAPLPIEIWCLHLADVFCLDPVPVGGLLLDFAVYQ